MNIEVPERRCHVCGETKPINEFNSQGKCCLLCHKERNRQWRESHREEYRKSQRKHAVKRNKTDKYKSRHKEYARNWYHKNKDTVIRAKQNRLDQREWEFAEWLVLYFKEHPCVDCGESNPLKLSFDHVRGVKSFNISGSTHRRSLKRIKEEIEKCDVRCLNCHAARTAEVGKFMVWRVLNNEPRIRHETMGLVD